jgi:hypothetical protein
MMKSTRSCDGRRTRVRRTRGGFCGTAAAGSCCALDGFSGAEASARGGFCGSGRNSAARRILRLGALRILLHGFGFCGTGRHSALDGFCARASELQAACALDGFGGAGRHGAEASAPARRSCRRRVRGTARRGGFCARASELEAACALDGFGGAGRGVAGDVCAARLRRRGTGSCRRRDPRRRLAAGFGTL